MVIFLENKNFFKMLGFFPSLDRSVTKKIKKERNRAYITQFLPQTQEFNTVHSIIYLSIIL